MALASPPSSARSDRSSRRGSGRRAPAGAGVRRRSTRSGTPGSRWRPLGGQASDGGEPSCSRALSPPWFASLTRTGVLAGSRCLGRWGTVPGRDTGRPPDGGIRLGPCGGPNRAGVTLGRSHRPHSDRPYDTATAIGWRITWVIRPTYDLSVGGDPLADSTGDHLHPSPADSPRTRRFPGGQSPGTDAVVVTRMVTQPNVPAHVGL
jgi:hypothetical protein